MKILGSDKLVEFQRKHARFEAPIAKWARVVALAAWKKFADIRATFNSVDKVDRCFVFNVSGNSIRIISKVDFSREILAISLVLTHREYAKGNWRKDCRQ